MTEPWSNNQETPSQIDHASTTKMKRQHQQKKQREAQREKNTSLLMENGYTDEVDQDGCEDDEYDEADILKGETACKDIGEDVCEVNGKRKATPCCWLCEYQGNRTTNEVIRFIMDGIPHMALDALITQSKYLLDRVDVGSNCSISQIKVHVTSHMLHPRVKLALQLQEMVKMQQDVSKCCVVDDVETGGKTINPQAMKVYLTLCTQITGVYKVGEERLTFNQASSEK
jgi:hypothetical protein